VARITRDRRVWISALLVWLALGVGLAAWVGSLTYSELVSTARSVTPVQTGAHLPADLPADFPIYPGAKVVQSFRGGASPAARGVGWESPDPPNHVYDFYRNALKAQPWRVLAAVPYPVGTISFLHESRPLLTCSLAVGKTKRGTTLFVFQYAPG
jgi:hypothetical protein